jgi:DNA-binding GntR family transcriptional regulator
MMEEGVQVIEREDGPRQSVQEIVEEIDRMIGDGRLSPGQRLVESDMTEEMGVSRHLVREAIRILAGDGVVELIPNKSPRVRRMSRTQLAQRQKVLTTLNCAAIEELLERPDGRTVLDAIGAVVAELETARERKHISRILSLWSEIQDLIIGSSRNDYLRELVRKTRCGNHKLQLLVSMREDTILTASCGCRPLLDAMYDGDIANVRRRASEQLQIILADLE